MTFTVSLGWWFAPLLVTLLGAFVSVHSAIKYRWNLEYSGNFHAAVVRRSVTALIASETAWLIWALLT